MQDRTGLFVGWYDADPNFLPEMNLWHSGEHKREKPEAIFTKLRQVEVLQWQGMSVADAVR